MEVERNNYASKGVAGTGLGTGIAGLSLGVLNLLGGLAGAAQIAAQPVAQPVASAFGGNCSDNMPVNRYELELQQKIAAQEAQIALRDANTYGDQKMLELYKYLDGELKDIRSTLGNQAVHNQRTEDSFVLVRQDLQCVKNELEGKIKAEADKRCCADNALVTYVNASFYPKMVADVTTGTDTTAQSLYNPLPNCGGCCGS